MKSMQKYLIFIVPAIALALGLAVGWGIGNMQVKKEQKICQKRLKEAGRKAAHMQRKLEDDKSEAAAALEIKCKADIDKLDGEKKALASQMGKLKDNVLGLEKKLKETEDASARIKKELADMEQKYAQATQHCRDRERDLKNMTGERDKVQSELKRTGQALERCETNNARLVVMAEDLLKKYKDKGIVKAVMEKEPLTQIKKVEMEQLAQEYKEEIEQLKIRKK